MKLGFIGLGKMGKNMVLHLLEQGVEVVAWNRSPEPLEEVAKAGAIKAENLKSLIFNLKSPRLVWLMLPAGQVSDQFIDEVLPLLSPGDLLIDGANSFYKDTLRRAEKIQKAGIRFMDIGVSGGPAGARNGACLMIGASQQDFLGVKPLIEAIAAPGAYGHFGPVGTGHFAKMVHNGIEYGMMESIGEGAAVLKASQFNLDLTDIFRVYNNRSVIESRLVGWTKEVLEEDPQLTEISSVIKSSGEGEWTVNTAKELGIEVPVIEDSLKVRQDSINDKEDSANGFRNEAKPLAPNPNIFRNKIVSALRGKFGQHDVKKN